MKIDRTGVRYGDLEGISDTGRRPAKYEWIWSARCLNVRHGATCGNVVQTHKLGQQDGPVRCPACSTAMFCMPKDIAGKVVSGWKAIRRYAAGDWKFRCIDCGQVKRTKATSVTPCRKCHPLPKPPQKITTKDYPALLVQIQLVRAKLAGELSAGNVIEVSVGGGRYSAFVSAADAPKVLPYHWHVIPGDNDMFYAGTNI